VCEGAGGCVEQAASPKPFQGDVRVSERNSTGAKRRKPVLNRRPDEG